MNKLYLLNSNKETVRVFNLQETIAQLIYCMDSGRVELVKDVEELKKSKRKFEFISNIDFNNKQQFPISIPGWGLLSLSEADNLHENVSLPTENKKIWWSSLSVAFIGGLSFATMIHFVPQITPAIEDELKQHVVKIIKRSPKIQQQNVVATKMAMKTQKSPTKKVKQSVNRVGALAILGRLNKNTKQMGGLNLGAVKTSPGPGLGGTKGSGGVQTSLYGKGVIAAPVGAGNNVQGAGGYGTKGRGGGQDGFGQMSLVGSLGTASIPLGKEAIIQGGLDQESIASVIRRNMGQITFCYEQGLQNDPKLMGRVAVDFTIGSSGQVKIANLSSSTLHSQIVENCILMRLKTWRFPSPEGGVDVKVSYPFMLRRLGSG
ncbi:MAG: AgmX/PglI C-terminal domain-containing protein [Bdellovibrionales bacterium]|nr:AgmX/PglI C-terminal domain-containing protein [Bdellovibrionales bacterium]